MRQLWRVHSVLPSPSSSCRASALPPDHLGAGHASCLDVSPLWCHRVHATSPPNQLVDRRERRWRDSWRVCTRYGVSSCSPPPPPSRPPPRVAATALRPTELSHFRTGEIPPPPLFALHPFSEKISDVSANLSRVHWLFSLSSPRSTFFRSH